MARWHNVKATKTELVLRLLHMSIISNQMLRQNSEQENLSGIYRSCRWPRECSMASSCAIEITRLKRYRLPAADMMFLSSELEQAGQALLSRRQAVVSNVLWLTSSILLVVHQADLPKWLMEASVILNKWLSFKEIPSRAMSFSEKPSTSETSSCKQPHTSTRSSICSYLETPS